MKKAPATKSTSAGKKAPSRTTARAPAKAARTTTAAKTSVATPTPTARAGTGPSTTKATTLTSATAGGRPPAKKAPAKKVPAKKAASTRTASRTAPKDSHAIAHRLRVKDDESPWSAEEFTEVRGILLEEIETHRGEVALAQDELDQLLRASGDGAGDDEADAGAKTAEREHEIALAANARASLAQAEHALEQLEAGTYGVCENCGNPIGKLRLQARPRATLCMTCQEKQDRH